MVVPSNPLTAAAHGNVSRVLPQGQSSGKVVAGWLPAGARLAMAFGTMSAALFESAANRSPEPAVLFYATDDDRAGEEVERLIRTDTSRAHMARVYDFWLGGKDNYAAGRAVAEQVEPGVVQVHRWRPGTGDPGSGRNLAIYAGVGRKP